MQNSYSWSYVHLEGKIVTIPATLLKGQKRLRLPWVIPSAPSFMLILLKCKFRKYCIHKASINDKATSTFGGISVEPTESTICVKYGKSPIYRRKSQNAIILVKLVQGLTLSAAFLDFVPCKTTQHKVFLPRSYTCPMHVYPWANVSHSQSFYLLSNTAFFLSHHCLVSHS